MDFIEGLDMKKFMIGYIFISLLLAVALYFTTLTLSYNERVYDIFEEISEEAIINQNFDAFVSYQSSKYKNIDEIKIGSYMISIYHILGTEESGHTNQLGFFVLPIGEVRHAVTLDDAFDQTKLVLTNIVSGEAVYDTSNEEAYEHIAVSFGIEKMGYYYYTFNIDTDIELFIKLYDYDGHIINEGSQTFQDQDDLDVDTTFMNGITQKELESLIDQETYIYPKLMRNMTIYIIVDVLFGSLLYFLIKYKKNHL